MARNQKNEVSFVIHNLPVIAKMAAVAKACGNMFQLLQGHAAETSGGLLICLPREQAAAYCKVFFLFVAFLVFMSGSYTQTINVWVGSTDTQSSNRHCY
jgi:hypothetical protein